MKKIFYAIFHIINKKRIHNKLDKLQQYDSKTQLTVLQELFDIVQKSDQPNLFDDHVYQFVFFNESKKWYQHNAELWLLYNGLPFANRNLCRNFLQYNYPR